MERVRPVLGICHRRKEGDRSEYNSNTSPTFRTHAYRAYSLTITEGEWNPGRGPPSNNAVTYDDEAKRKFTNEVRCEFTKTTVRAPGNMRALKCLIPRGVCMNPWRVYDPRAQESRGVEQRLPGFRLWVTGSERGGRGEGVRGSRD
jgi:hypothetical protein